MEYYAVERDKALRYFGGSKYIENTLKNGVLLRSKKSRQKPICFLPAFFAPCMTANLFWLVVHTILCVATISHPFFLSSMI